jgi:signal transduction histidine kinase
VRVLVAEDHVTLAGRIAQGLRQAGMAVDAVCDGAAALDAVAQTAYDVIVLDRDLPVVHGDRVCRAVAGSGPRILMLTAAAGIEDRVDGLELGADDYLGKPFAFVELVARVRALSRRAPSAPPILQRGDLQAAFEGQQRFIANASHELRTPLAVMGATVDVVLDNPDSTPGDLCGMAADIRAAVDHAEHLIGALLILARNERGLTVRDEVDLATAAEDVIDVVSVGARRVHATLEPAAISGDPVLAERLIANLVDNAVRYNHVAGDIWISTRTIAGSSQLTVANTGPVINPADVGRIFQPFQRLSDRTSHDGAGLGLAIVASIAGIHGGTATARPRDEGGLFVTVTIPASATAAQGSGIQASDRPVVPRPT